MLIVFVDRFSLEIVLLFIAKINLEFLLQFSLFSAIVIHYREYKKKEKLCYATVHTWFFLILSQNNFLEEEIFRLFSGYSTMKWPLFYWFLEKIGLLMDLKHSFWCWTRLIDVIISYSSIYLKCIYKFSFNWRLFLNLFKKKYWISIGNESVCS